MTNVAAHSRIVARVLSLIADATKLLAEAISSGSPSGAGIYRSAASALRQAANQLDEIS